ncbi:MAG TPA: hypothetical protein V6C97_04285 [Oculatellaceae cyanobacterium]
MQRQLRNFLMVLSLVPCFWQVPSAKADDLARIQAMQQHRAELNAQLQQTRMQEAQMYNYYNRVFDSLRTALSNANASRDFQAHQELSQLWDRVTQQQTQQEQTFHQAEQALQNEISASFFQ